MSDVVINLTIPEQKFNPLCDNLVDSEFVIYSTVKFKVSRLDTSKMTDEDINLVRSFLSYAIVCIDSYYTLVGNDRKLLDNFNDLVSKLFDDIKVERGIDCFRSNASDIVHIMQGAKIRFDPNCIINIATSLSGYSYVFEKIISDTEINVSYHHI